MRLGSCQLGRISLSATLGLLAFALSGNQAAAEETLAGALTGGKPIIDLRMRYEHVEQDGLPDNADAYTGRARLGYETGSFRGLSALVDFDLIGHAGPEDYNDTINGRTSYPVVADPDTAELNRLQIAYAGIPGTVVTLGRQRIILGNARFVGNVGWRQNEQTFDALRVVNESLPDTVLGYAYVNRVNRVFGEDSPVGRFRGDTHLFNVDYAGFADATIGGYAYLLDLEEAPALSTATYGVRLSKPFGLSDTAKLTLTGEYARQEDHADNPLSLDLDYYLGEAALAWGPASLAGGYEVLGSDGTTGFSTPLATLHAFNGWADVFLATPAAGLEDAYAKASYAITDLPLGKKLVFGVGYHDFSSERGGIDFGSEIDAVIDLILTDAISLSLKFTSFDGDGGYASRDKSWLSLTYAY